MELHGQHLIGFTTSRENDEAFAGVDPAAGQPLTPRYAEASEREIDRALRLAHEAHAALRDVAPERRAAFLERIAGELEGLGDELLQRASRETGLPSARMVVERGRTVGQLRMFAAVVREGSWVGARIDHAVPDRQPVPKPDVRQVRVPVGPVVVFGASNFPLAFSVPGGDTASALAAGCPVVVKAHPAHPGTSELAGRAIAAAARACELPEGTFSMVHGATAEVGAMLVRHPLAKAVAFTGSLRGGRALFDLAAARPEPIPVFAEMGSTNPVFPLPGALAARGAQLADALAKSMTMGCGQFCTNPGFVVVPAGGARDAFVHALLAALTDLAPGTMLHRGIRDGYLAGVERWAAIDGVTVHRGRAGEGTQVPAAVFECDAATWRAHPELREELFGPCTLVVTCRDHDDLLALAADVRGQLTATLHADPGDHAAAAPLVATLRDRVGRVVWNAFPTGVEVCDSMFHGGPYPATTDARTTSVGSAAIERFARPVCYQGFPAALLPPALRDDNPLGILRLVDGAWTR